MDFFLEFKVMDYITEIIDIALVTFVIYKIITLIRGTRAVQLLKGMMVIVLCWVLSSFFGLQTLSFLMNQALTYGVLAILIIFQPELRRALEQLGRGRLFSRTNQPDEELANMVITETVKAVQYMAKRRIGALLVFERLTGLNDYAETGTPIGGQVSSELIINLFVPNTPLHDGAVLIRKEQVLAAACYLPLSENQFISKELGTRHRAALGISELTDCISVIVSEETGQISIAINGEIRRDIGDSALTEILETELHSPGKTTSSFWVRGKKNG
jgi:diadenylate cyclase